MRRASHHRSEKNVKATETSETPGGYLLTAELRKMAQWKSHYLPSKIDENPPGHVEKITAEAFSPGDDDETYDFTLFIARQSPDTLNNDGSFNIWAYIFTGKSKTVTTDELVNDAFFNNKRYQGAVVRFTGVVKRNSVFTVEIETDTDDFDNFDDFWIRKVPDADYSGYTVNQAYTFTAFIRFIGKEDAHAPASIDTYFIKP